MWDPGTPPPPPGPAATPVPMTSAAVSVITSTGAGPGTSETAFNGRGSTFNNSYGIDVSIGPAGMDSLLRDTESAHALVQDRDHSILEFPSHAGTFSTPKPSGGFFQPTPHTSDYYFAENGNNNTSLIANASTSTVASNGNGFGLTDTDTSAQALHPENGGSGSLSLIPGGVEQHHRRNTFTITTNTNEASVPEAEADLDKNTNTVPKPHSEVSAVAEAESPAPPPVITTTPPPPVYKCTHCTNGTKRFGSIAQLNMHTKKVHPEAVPVESESESEPPNETEELKSTTTDASRASAGAGSTYTIQEHNEPVQEQIQVQEQEAEKEKIKGDQDQEGEKEKIKGDQDQEEERTVPEPEPASEPTESQSLPEPTPAKPQIHPSLSAFYCEVCRSTFGNYSHLKRHLGTMLHRTNVKALESSGNEAQSQAADQNVSVPGSSAKAAMEDLKCEVCNLEMTSAHILRRHYLTLAHQKRVRETTEQSEDRQEQEVQSVDAQARNKDTEEVEEAESQESASSSPGRRLSTRARRPPPSFQPPPPEFSCEICSVDFDNAYSLKRHNGTQAHQKKERGATTSTEAEQNAYTYGCQTCAVSFPTSEDLEHHYLSTHLSLRQDEIAGPSRKTQKTVTPTKSPTTISHRQDMNCEVCGYNFKDAYHMRRHFMSQTHQRKMEEHEQSERAIPEVILKEEEEGEVHAGSDQEEEEGAEEVSDVEVRRFHCEQCDTSYKKASDIKKHYNTLLHKKNYAAHMGAAAHMVPAPAPDVDVNTPRVRTSLTAMQSNDPRRKYHCNVCKTSYLSGTHLRRHFTTDSHQAMVETGGVAAEGRVALPVRPSAMKMFENTNTPPASPSTRRSALRWCEVCDKNFSNPALRNMHMKKAHPDFPLEEEGEDEEEERSQQQKSEMGNADSVSLPTIIGKGGKRRFVCQVCNTDYKGSYDLQRHFKTVSHVNRVAEGGESIKAPLKRASEPGTSVAAKKKTKKSKGKKKKGKPRPRSLGGASTLSHFLGPFAAPPASSGGAADSERPKCVVCNRFYSSDRELRRHYITLSHQREVAAVQGGANLTSGSSEASEIEEDGDDQDQSREEEQEEEQDRSGSDGEAEEEDDNGPGTGMQIGHLEPGTVLSAKSPSRAYAASTPRKRIRISCETCGTSYQGQRDLQRHYNTGKHKAMVAELEGSSEGRPGPKSKKRARQHRCNTCETYYDNEFELAEHKKSTPHSTAVRINQDQANGGGEGGVDMKEKD